MKLKLKNNWKTKTKTKKQIKTKITLLQRWQGTTGNGPQSSILQYACQQHSHHSCPSLSLHCRYEQLDDGSRLRMNPSKTGHVAGQQSAAAQDLHQKCVATINCHNNCQSA